MNNLLLMAVALFFAFFLGYILKCMFCKHRNSVSGFSGWRLFVLLLALLWAALSLWWYACKIKDMCEVSPMGTASLTAPAQPPVVEEESVTVEEIVAPTTPPLAFSWSSDTPITSDQFASMKDSIVGDLPDGDVLRVVGYAYDEEKNDTAFGSLGLARAVSTARMFTDRVDESRIVVAGEDRGAFDSDSAKPFEAIKFEYAPAPAPIPQAAAPGDGKPLWFAWSGDQPRVGDAFEALKAKLVSQAGTDNALQITGSYFADEKNATDFDNLGEARAAKVRELLAGAIDKTRLLIAGKRVDGNSTDARHAGFDAVDIKVIPLSQAGFKVKEQGNRRLVYFPFNSHDARADVNLVSYLADLAQELKQSDKSITIVGHTDSRGVAAYNQQLGMQRARMIADILIAKGVEPAKVRTRSMGEREPIASNATEQGRAENRRAELIIH